MKKDNNIKYLLNKKIYAYGSDKHNPCLYSYIGIIKSIDNDYIYVYDHNNPIGYKDYKINKNNFNKWMNQRLYILR